MSKRFEGIISAGQENVITYGSLEKSIEGGSCSTQNIENALSQALISLEQAYALMTLFGKQKELREKKLEEECHIDVKLTGLRTDLMPELHNLIEELRLHPGDPLSSVVVLYLDLNKFKPINDKYGHAAGDDAIFQFTKKLRTLIDRTDTIFRVHGENGDEFAVVMPISKDLTEEEVIRIFQRVFNGVSKFDVRINNPGEKKIDNIELSASVGYAIYKNGDTEKTLVDRADQSMYEHKNRSKGKTT